METPEVVIEPEVKKYPAFITELITRVESLEQQFAAKNAKAEEAIAKVRIRLETESQRTVELELQKILLGFVQVLDNLERAQAAAGLQESIAIGLQLTVSMFLSKLHSAGVEEIDVLGKPFSPETSFAIGVVPVDDPAQDGIVIHESMKGYMFRGQLLRAAHVRVGCKRSIEEGEENADHA